MGRVTRWWMVSGIVACAMVAAPAAVAQEAPPPPDAPPALDPVPAPPATVVAEFRAPRSVAYGQRVPVRGRIAPAARVRVVVERVQNRRWVALATVTADARGRFAADLPLRSSGTLRARPVAAGGEGVAGRPRNVAIQRRASVSVTAHEYEWIAGRPLAVTGAVVPARDGEVAVLEASRDGRAFLPLARLRVNQGRVAGAVRVSDGGVWRFRLRAAARGTSGPAVSAASAPRRIFAANPHNVPASEPKYLVQKISEMHLYYYESGQLVRVLPVVFGKPSTPTPIGRFRVYSKTVGPGPAFGPLAIWYHGNYGIHGTNQEYLLKHSWRYYSKGCTRNYNVNIYWLWDRVPVGTPVLNVH